MAEVLEQAAEAVDPRVRRTRQMLQDAMEALLAEKEFDKISVQDIADRATLHRATFYDHYDDKFALLECMVASRFMDLLAKRGVSFSACSGALRTMALGVCDYISSVPGAGCGSQTKLEGHMESAVIEVVRRMILHGIRKHEMHEKNAELVAAAASWAIYGAAKSWMHSADRCKAEEIAGKIEKLVQPILTAE